MGISGCFHFFATVLGTTINTAVRVSVLMGAFIFTGYMPSSGTAGSYANSIFSLFQKLHTGEGDGQEVLNRGDICIHMADSC